MRNLFIITTLFFSADVFAQSYSFTVSNEAYQHLQGSTSLNEGRTWDDPDYEVPIGFKFKVFGNEFENVYFDGYSELMFLNNDNDEISIAAIDFLDVIDRAYDLDNDEDGPGSLSNISYLLDGQAGSRIFKFELRNVGFYEDISAFDSSVSYGNYQIWLYENSNIIEFRYGESNIIKSVVYDDVAGPVVMIADDYEVFFDDIHSAVMLSGSPTNPQLNVFDKKRIDFENFPYLNDLIPNGTVYRFTPTDVIGVEKVVKNKAFASVYPNPANNVVNIKNANFQYEKVTVKNIFGQVVQEINEYTEQVDISDLPSGVYFINLFSANASLDIKFIKE